MNGQGDTPYETPKPEDFTIPWVTIWEQWETIDGVVYYKWKLEGESEWNYKKTAQKEPPYFMHKRMPREEYELKLLSSGAVGSKNPAHPKDSTKGQKE